MDEANEEAEIISDTADHSSPLVLPEILDASVNGAIKDQLANLILNSPRVSVDASNVERIGAAGAQLFLSLSSTLSDAGGQLHIMNASEEFRKSLCDMGLEDSLKTWEGQNGQEGPDN